MSQMSVYRTIGPLDLSICYCVLAKCRNCLYKKNVQFIKVDIYALIGNFHSPEINYSREWIVLQDVIMCKILYSRA